MNQYSPIRPSPIAGSWYPANPAALEQEISAYIKHAAVPVLPGKVLGLIAPHAGYFYSGSTAGYAYRCVEGMHFDLCAVFSPLHDYYPYDLLTSAHEYYATPFGKIRIDQDIVAQCSQSLQELTGAPLQHIANDREHSLEIQLPFLQTALSSPFSLLPVMVRSHEPDLLQKAAQAFSGVLKDKNVLMVASTDLSHFYDQKSANAFDAVMLRHMTAFSPQGVLEAERTDKGFACGAGAVALMLWTCQALGGTTVTLLHHSTSADASGDTSRVVGYGAAAVTR